MSSAFEKRRKETGCGTGFNVRLWCNKDPCGLICAVLSWFLVLYAECVVVVRPPHRYCLPKNMHALLHFAEQLP